MLPLELVNIWRRVSENTNVTQKKKQQAQYLYLVRTGQVVVEPQLTWRQRRHLRIMKKAEMRQKQIELQIELQRKLRKR